MTGIFRSRRRRLVATVAVAVGLISTALALFVLPEEPTIARGEGAEVALERLGDGAADAEARILLASLRATVTDGPSPETNGTGARRLTEQLERTLDDARLERLASAEASVTLETLRTQITTGDPNAIATIAELETVLRSAAAYGVTTP